MTVRPQGSDVVAGTAVAPPAPARYAFGDVDVDLRRMTVSVGGTAVSLEPKSFDVLVHLLAHRDRLVTKEELLSTIWGDTFVTPNVLTRAVAQVRKAIGDDAQDARYIETVARRGYRVVAEVVELPALADRVLVPPRLVGPPANGTAEAVAPAGSPVRSRRPWVGAGTLAAVALAALVVAAFGWWRTHRRASATAAAVEAVASPAFGMARRMSARAGVDTQPALSPDGRSLAFVSDRTGAHEIHVVALTPGAREVAVTSDGGQNTQPAWSPDGAWIAFHSRKRRGVWVVPATGGAARQVVDFGSRPAWSPDGTRIAFTSDAGGMAGQSVIGTVRPDGTGRTEVTRIGGPPGGHREPAWSRDGKTLVFAVSSGRWSQEIWTVPAAGGAPRRVAAPFIGGLDPQFAPGDRALYWGAGSPRFDGFALWVQPMDASTMTPTGPAVDVAPVGGFLEGLSIAADGSIAYGAGSADQNLWAVDLADDGAPGEPVRLTHDAVRASFPDHGPDGRISFLQAGPGRPSAVWLMAADGSAAEPLLDEAPVGGGQWLRDGRMLVYRHRATPPSLWIVDPATRRMTGTAVTGDDVQSSRPSPDGREVAFHVIEPDGSMNVWIQALGGGPRRRVTSDAEAMSYPAWSPDGRFLALEIKRGDQTHVGLVSRDGGRVEQLTSEPGQSWPHSFSPDGEHIAFAAERDGVWNVYAVSRRTRAVRQLTRFASSSGYVRYPAWSRDGKRIVFERSIRQASVWVRRPARPGDPPVGTFPQRAGS
jgi:Tol biopolymer transport system component/DNA-binding winged helix-turn-helix (wHTH) protein